MVGLALSISDIVRFVDAIGRRDVSVANAYWNREFIELLSYY